MSKVFYFDVETTGTDPKIHEIIQFAAIVVIDGKEVNSIKLDIQPTRWDVIEPDAIATHGISIEAMQNFMNPKEAMYEIKNFMGNHVDKYDRADKYYPAGHNVGFDLDFLQAFWKQHGDKYGSGTYQNWRAIDTRVLVNLLNCMGALPVENIKLETLCQHFGIELVAHDALSDIRATRTLLSKLIALLSSV